MSAGRGAGSAGCCPVSHVQHTAIAGARLKLSCVPSHHLPSQGLSKAAVAQQADELLESVKLGGAAGVRTGAYSGGMRRRLRCGLLGS